MGRQVLQARQPHVGDGEEVLGCAVSARGALRLFELAVHRFDDGVAAVIEHAAYDRGETLINRERLAAPGGKGGG